MSLHTKPTERSKPPGRFKQALIASNKLSIIAEVKRRSPSRGNLNTTLDPAQLAVAYRDGGAVCLSVLTNQAMFGGNSNDLRKAATASGLPVLRKDFITTTQDVYESQEMGADAILLIVADLATPAPSDPDLKELHSLALSLGMDVLVEVKSPDELDLALAANAEIIGVNQRAKPKSQAYTMDFQRAQQMAPLLPNNVVKVAESGIGVAGGTTIDEVRQAGYDAALIGEALVTADNPVLLLQEFLA
ncbi:MAG: indole-3-glycerol-phosphate synthase [bacterium]|nr:indole-3-glycerol-phosphate synthase [bacterium]